MTVSKTRGVTLAAFLVGISMFVLGAHLHAQDWTGELHAQGERGDASAQLTLGFMYDRGQRVPQQSATAAFWYGRAADQGHADAQFNLGRMYANGDGVPRDSIEAHMWYDLSAAQLSGEEREKLVRFSDAIAERMTAEQIAEAQRLAREWTPTPEP